MQRFGAPRTIYLAAGLAAAATLAPPPAVGQPTPAHFCSAIEPEVKVQVGEGEDAFDAYRWRQCEFDFDGDEDFERTAYFFELRGSESDPPFILDEDRHCYQGESFNPLDSEPDAGVYGYNGFALMLPADYQSGDFPVYLDLRGATAGWVADSAALSAWALDVEAFPPSWEKGLYRGQLQFAQGSANNQNILGRLLNTAPLRTRIRAKDGGAWGILAPSACSHDGYNGRPQIPGIPGQGFEEAERTRFGFVSIVEALRLVEQEWEIEYLYTGATSGGGMGSYIFARFLPGSLDFLAEPGRYRGAIVDAAPVEFGAMAQLYDSGHTIFVHSGEDCQAQPDAEVPCAHPAEPLATNFDEENGLTYSASEDIFNQVVNVPLLHAYNRRGNEHCYSLCYSEANIHGPIATEIEARKADLDDIPFRFSENLQMCVGSCRALNNGPVLECTKHGVIGNAVDCAEDWINAINAFWDDDIGYQTPASCLNIPAQEIATNPEECGPQGGGTI